GRDGPRPGTDMPWNKNLPPRAGGAERMRHPGAAVGHLAGRGGFAIVPRPWANTRIRGGFLDVRARLDGYHPASPDLCGCDDGDEMDGGARRHHPHPDGYLFDLTAPRSRGDWETA